MPALQGQCSGSAFCVPLRCRTCERLVRLNAVLVPQAHRFWQVEQENTAHRLTLQWVYRARRSYALRAATPALLVDRPNKELRRLRRHRARGTGTRLQAAKLTDASGRRLLNLLAFTTFAELSPTQADVMPSCPGAHRTSTDLSIKLQAI